MNILSLDTTFLDYTSAGIITDSEKRISLTLQSKASQQTKIVSVIDTLLKNIDLDIKDIDLLITTIGPGSFTGLRIGITFMISLANTLNKPIAGLCSLDILKESCKLIDNNSLYIPVIDAKINKVFTAIYNNDKRLSDYLDIEPHLLCRMINEREEKNIVFIGDGYQKYKEVFSNDIKNKTIFDYGFKPLDPEIICIKGLEYYINNKESCTVSNIHPLYLRKSEAENRLLV